MIPGPANILSCPFCGGKKEVMSLISGNTCEATVWSDTRRDYPMLPEVSPIQKCPHCGKYYFVEQAKSEYSKSDRSYSFELGLLNYEELLASREQMSHLSLTKMQRWILNHQLFMAYNDKFRRNEANVESYPTEEDERIYFQTIEDLLDGIEQSSDYDLFHAELLREIGRFDEAKAILLQHESDDDKWVVDSMIKHIEAEDSMPFLLIKDGYRVQ